MTWLSVLQLLLRLAGAVADVVREKQLMDAGEAKATARSLAVLQDRLGLAEQVRAEVEALSDEELNAELRGD